MSGQIRKTESGTEAVLRIIRRELKDARKDLRGRGILPDEVVHGARKRLNKARAALRLVRTALGDRRYRRVNVSLRDIARPLTAVRDAKIVVDTFEKLVKGLDASSRAKYQRLHDALMSQRIRTRERILIRRERLDSVRKAIQAAGRRIARWQVEDAGWSVLGPGLKRVYQAGRAAFAAVRSDPSVENLHEWRKQSKYLRHQLEFLEPLSPRVFQRLARRSRALTDRLGDDHDLAVLRQRLQRRSRQFSPAAVDRLIERIDRRRAALQEQANALGVRLYHESPRQFERRLEPHWRAW
jgi:CHAD domain-containing protein